MRMEQNIGVAESGDEICRAIFSHKSSGCGCPIALGRAVSFSTPHRKDERGGSISAVIRISSVDDLQTQKLAPQYKSERRHLCGNTRILLITPGANASPLKLIIDFGRRFNISFKPEKQDYLLHHLNHKAIANKAAATNAVTVRIWFHNVQSLR